MEDSMNVQWKVMCAAAMTALCVSSAFAQNPAVGRRTPVPVPGKKSLPLRVLARPRSNIYQEANEASAKVQENVPAFQPFYVYTQPPVNDEDQPTGWYEVGGDSRGGVLGWMRAEDVMEWKQAMCLAYTHPEGRQPVLMFANRKAIDELASADSEDRVAKANAYYETISKGAIPAEFPIISMEPRRSVFMFIEDQFYLLPILDHKETELDGREGRILKMAAATLGERGATTLQDKDFVENVSAEADAKSKKLAAMKVEIVYVIDMSASMQPYIDATRTLVATVSAELAKEPGLSERVRFGLWGFRDSEEIEGIEFNTKNFTPALQDSASFLQTLTGVEEAKVGSRGIPEDVFSGVDDAMRKTAWSEGSIRFIVLVGDAPGHLLGEKWNASGQDENTLRNFANDNKFSVYPILIRSKPAQKFLDLSEKQFKTLGMNPGTYEEESAFSSVDSEKPEQFGVASAKLLGIIRLLAQNALQGDVSGLLAKTPVSDDDEAPATAGKPADDAAANGETDVGADTERRARAMVRAALVDWLGAQDGATSPRDVTAWVSDKDLVDPAVQSLEVRVLINKNQLDSLRTVLQEIMLAGRQGQKSNKDFFEELQATSAGITVTPEQIKNARNLASTGVVPEFLLDLPYKSRIMSMNNEVWAGWSQDQQDEFLNDVDAKISLYAAIHDNPAGWVKLNAGDDEDESVHPINLDMLP
jgi:hypothetical protein